MASEHHPAGRHELTELVPESYSREVDLPRQASPHRLARPRTSPFHGGNGGSNPPGDATHLIRKRYNRLGAISEPGTPEANHG